MRRRVVGVMGAGDGAADVDCANAYQLGQRIAQRGWALLTGGRDAGVMRAANAGARQVPDSLTIGILPRASSAASPDVDVVIRTDLGNGRNNVNVLSSDVVVACGRGGPGTVSEVALAVKVGKPVLLLAPDDLTRQFFLDLSHGGVQIADTVEAAVDVLDRLLV
jgi:uncharacterized protein (TIGR00725 family)